MKLDDIFNESGFPSGNWYHGSGMHFDRFDTEISRVNRGTNVSGVYLTQDIDTAREYASRADDGVLYTVTTTVSNPASEFDTPPTDEMIEAYITELVKNTNYREHWARTAIAPDYKERGVMKSDLDGDIKRAVFMAGGYDSYYFNDMGSMSLVVFDPDNITIIAKTKV